MKKILLLLALCLMPSLARAAGGTCPSGTPGPPTNGCYFIANSGLDTNSGTSESSPWAHAPGMPSCSNNCAALSAGSGGIGLIFRGGDTWHFGENTGDYAGGTWSLYDWFGNAYNSNITTCVYEGTQTGCVYVGVDMTWYSGSAWARPILTGDNPTTPFGIGQFASSCAYQIPNSQSYGPNSIANISGYTIFDNFELTGVCVSDNPPSTTGDGYLSGFGSSGNYFTPALLENLYIHGWSATSTAGVGNFAPVTLIHGGGGVQQTFDHIVIDGSDSNPQVASGGTFPIFNHVRDSIFRYVGAQMVGAQCHDTHDNIWEHNYLNLYSGHINVFECNSDAALGTPNVFYNNIVRHNDPSFTGGAPVWWFCPNTTPEYLWNNIMFDTLGEGGFNFAGTVQYPSCVWTGGINVFNNIFLDGTASGWQVQCGVIGSAAAAQIPYLNQFNNLLIATTFGGTSPFCNGGSSSSTNVILTDAQATSQGYTTGTAGLNIPNNCTDDTTTPCPTTAVTDATVGTGTNFQSYCSTLATYSSEPAIGTDAANACKYETTDGCVYNSTTHAMSCYVQTPLARPTSAAWDSGAYQFNGVSGVIVNWTTTYQEIDGFGASDAQSGLGTPTPMTSAQQDFFFGLGAGQLGISLLRTGVTDGSDDPGSCTSVGSSCAGNYVSDMQAIVANGGRVYATSWTPPAAYKSNSSATCTAGAGNGTLSNSSGYATWLVNFVKSLAADGITLYAISPQNEPNYCPSYDGAVMTAAQQDSFIGGYLGPAFASNSISTLILMPETTGYSAIDGSNGGGTCMTDSTCYQYVGGVNFHDYDSTYTAPDTVNSDPYPAGWATGKKYWETEGACLSSQSPTVPSWCPSGVNNNMTDALSWAAIIDQRLVNDGVNAWSWWWFISNNNSDDQGLMQLNGTIAPRAYMFGQYAKFIRPGWIRMSASHYPVSGTTVSAYQAPSGGNFAIVATNYTGSAVSLNFSLQNFPTVTSVTPYMTSSTSNLVQQSSVTVTGGAFSYSLPAQSIITFTGTASSGPPVDSFSPTSVAFGNQTTGSESSSQTVTLTNTGGSTDTISSISITGTNPSDFALTPANNCPTALASGSSCSIYVAFAPNVTGSLSASISITDTVNPGGAAVVSLTGTGITGTNLFSFSQQATPVINSGGSTCSISLPTNPATGDVVAVPFMGYITGSPGSLSVTSVKDSNSNSYSQAQSPVTNASSGATAFLWHLVGAPSNATSAITITFNTTSNRCELWAYDFTVKSGYTASADTGSTATGTASTVTTPSVTPAGANELFYGLETSPEDATAINAPWLGQITSIDDAAFYNVNATASAQTPNVTLAASGVYVSILQAVKASPSTPPPPAISSLSATSGKIGSSFTINGTNFGSSQGSSTATLNGAALTVTSWSATAIGVTVPSGATTGGVVVTTTNGVSNSVTFTVTPNLVSLSVSSGPVATSVTLTGTGFGSSQGSSTVTFNGTSATCSSWSSTSIVCAVPTAATTGNVVVTVSGNASSGISFTVTPFILSVSPTSGSIAAAVTINGYTFGSTQSSSTVTFNGTTATCTSWSSTQVICSVPTGATTGNVVVTVSSNASNGVNFTVTGPAIPAISSVSPNVAMVGTTITISGTGFGATQGSSTVTFSGIDATASSWSSTTIVCTVPAGTATGNIVVTTAGGPSNGVPFTLITVPVLIISGGTITNGKVQ